MLAGIKPTVGRVSRYGVIPIAADQDTPGPMARSVADAAIMLGAMEGADAGSQRPGDEHLHAATATRLHEVPAARRDSRAPASASRARSITTPRPHPANEDRTAA